ncbi:MAG: Spi family protease inhibitor, partial [Muribaculaceae bacterium]|nr:Spi family protease inhibitor [Muribaculaceae bacterium]
MSAKQIGVDEAKELVNRFVRENSRLKSLASGGDITLAYTEATNAVANYYVYNLAQGGFVIVSADDCVEQVLSDTPKTAVSTSTPHPKICFRCSKDISRRLIMPSLIV